MEMCGGLRLKRLMFGMITAQEARAARADRHAAIERGAGGVAKLHGLSEGEIIIGGKIDALPRSKHAPAMLRIESGKTAGVVIFSSKGEKVGFIATPEDPSNCCFGGKDKKTLYVTAGKSLYRITPNAEGFAVFWPDQK